MVQGKVAVARGICHPVVGSLVGRVLRDRVPNRGITYDTSDPIVSSRVKAMLLWGLYERAEIGFIQRHIRTDRDVVELGASLGVTGSHILHRIDAGRRLVAVEANPLLTAPLGRALAAAAPADRWSVQHAAISYGGTEVRLAIDEFATQGSRIGEDGVTVPATTLGRVVAGNGLDRYSLVCDIEGAEADVLQAEGEVLARCDSAVLELHPSPTTSVDDLVTLLTDVHGFAVVARRGPVVAVAR